MAGIRNRQGSKTQQAQNAHNHGETSTAAQAHSIASAGANSGAEVIIRPGHGRSRCDSFSMRGTGYGMASGPSGMKGRTEGSGRTTFAGRGALRWSTLGASASLVS